MKRDPETVREKIEQLRAELRSVLLRKREADNLDMYTRGILEGKRDSLLEFLVWLRPDYEVDGDTPKICAAVDCDEVFFRSAHRPDQAFHSHRCQNRVWMRDFREREKEAELLPRRQK